ncbi:MAG: CARDB domain-containing protein, partial [Bacteroidota bacterium]|nr:CARDB domain-containing protein [Bacteroidota bacterium]
MKTNHKHSLAVILWIICVQLFSYSNLTAQTVGFSVASKNPVENDTFNVAVRADSVLTGRGIYAFKLGLNYNSNYLEYLGIDSVGTVMKSWSIPTVNSQAAGTLVIAGAGASALMGKGNMFYLRFRAIQGGYTYIQNISSVSYLNEGSPVMSLNYGIINCSSIPKPDIYPDYQTLFVGETMQLYGYSGTPPYIFQTVNTAVATTTSAGLVTAVGPGTTQAFVTDSKGYKNYTYGNIDVRAVKLSVISTNTSPQDSFYLPIKIEIAPGTMIYSGSFELAFNSSLEGIKAAAITGDYNISVQNNAQANLVKVSFASGTGITGTGILCKVYMKAINSGVNSVNIQNVLCNETLLALTYSGNVTTECKPCVKATGLLPENGKQNLNSTVDLYWQPALNAKYYSLYLWEQGTTMPTSPYYSYIYGTSTWLYNLAPGKTFNWKLVSVNECSTAESDVQSFSVRPIPDLTVTDVQMPASVESGSAFTLTFTVKNIGQTTTGSSLWTDAVYMSTDSTGNSGMNYMVAKYNMGPLAVNGTYTQSYPVSVPAEYSGKYYLWVRADNSGSVTELSENNNQLRAINPITVELKPFPDILVKDIAASATATPGDSLQITWKVGNIGNASALGGWTERISLISNSGVRAYLNPTYITVTRDLAVGETITRTAKIKLPEVPRFSGNAKVE